MALRIIGGRAKGRRLRSPAGRQVRPTGDRVREALFNIWGQDLEGLRLLDVCAGSGAISLEALSRGAAVAVSLERDAALCRLIREEAGQAGLSDGLDVRQADALAGIERLRREGEAVFDLVFVDPPWREAALRWKILRLLFQEPPLGRGVVVECPSGEEAEVPPGSRLLRRARYGDTSLLFYEVEGALPPAESG